MCFKNYTLGEIKYSPSLIALSGESTVHLGKVHAILKGTGIDQWLERTQRSVGCAKQGRNSSPRLPPPGWCICSHGHGGLYTLRSCCEGVSTLPVATVKTWAYIHELANARLCSRTRVGWVCFSTQLREVLPRCSNLPPRRKLHLIFCYILICILK